MNNFGKYITPGQVKSEYKDERSLQELQKLARSGGKCENCDEDAWRYAGTGLCFSCTTGEADASEDMELTA